MNPITQEYEPVNLCDHEGLMGIPHTRRMIIFAMDG